MLFKKSYKILEILHENRSTIVHRAIRLEDEKNVILKMLRQSSRNEETITQFVNERKILSSIGSKSVVRLLDVISSPTEYIHVFEDIGGDSLSNIIMNKQLSLQDILEISLCISKAIDVIHKNDIIHADINPKNIVFNEKTKALQLIDFGYSVNAKYLNIYVDKNIISSGNLLYMSPEQIGVTRKQIDIRSDLYSFGMTMYHLFLGRVPFEAKDRYELVHKQVMFNPKPLHTVDNNIPIVVSKIVDKLIHKEPNDRYQSAEAVIYDLAKASKYSRTLGQISDFKIGTRNLPQINIGVKLFGRKDELQVLEEASKKLIYGVPVKGLVSGSAGIGKTRLINEFLSYITNNKSYVLSGKFEKNKENTPYSGFKQLILQIHTLLMSNKEKMDLSSLSSRSASILYFIFPELIPLLSPSARKLSSLKDNISIELPEAVKEMFSCLATEERPIIIFMDDLQWADESSLNLLQKSILDADIKYLHFVGSYRDKEIGYNRYALELVQKLIIDETAFVFNIKLSPLSIDYIDEMLTSMFSFKGKKLKELSRIVNLKTNGNPFYIKTLINVFIDDKKLYFKKGRWDYDIESAELYSSSRNIAQFIISKFKKLTKLKQRCLYHLALLGNHINIDLTMEMMSSFGFDNEIFKEIESDGFIYLSMNQYHFVHDQIQENIYDSIEAKQKRHIHLKIGKYLQNAYEANKYDDCVTLCEHLNRAYDDGGFPKYIFKLNVISLKNILSSGAYLLALEKLRWIDEKLFNESLWKSERNLAYEFKVLKIKTLYLNTIHSEAIDEVIELAQKANNIEEKLLCFTLYKNICVTQGKNFYSLVEFGNTIFNELGLKVPKDKNELKLSLDFLQEQISSNTLFDNPNEILNLPKLFEGKKKAISTLLMDYWEAAFYLADIELMQWAYLNIVHSSFKNGNSSESSFGYVLYGAQLVSQRDYKKSYLFSQICLKLNHDFNDESMLPKVYNFVANFINPYSKPLISNLVIYQKSLHQSRINGDIVFGTWANFLMHFSHYLSGANLQEVKEKINLESNFIRSSGDEKMIFIFDILIHTVESLQNADSIHIVNERRAVELWQKESFYPALAWYAVLRAQNCFFKASFDEGLKYLQEYVHTTSNEVIMFAKIRVHFIRALLLLGKNELLDEDEKKTLSSDLEEFESYIKASPATFRFEKFLLQAEQMKSASSAWDTVKVYDKALQEAKRTQNYFHLAISGLCAGRFWKRYNYNDLSSLYFDEALVGLKQWGALSLVKYIKERSLILQKPNADGYRYSLNSSNSQISDNNFKSLLTAFNTISKSSNTNELIHNLMHIILQSATASKAVLILKQEDMFFVRASIDFQKDEIKEHMLGIDESVFIPKNIVLYAINTAEKIDLQRPYENGKFQFDNYIKENRPASCICIPAFFEGSLTGVLYLENNELPVPIEHETIKTLEILLSQASIIYQRTSLYETIKTSEDNLNRAQEISHIGSWRFNSRTGMIEWSAETYRIYELEPFSLDIDGEWFFSHVHIDDLEYVSQAAKKTLEEEYKYDVIHRIILPNGKEKTVHQKAELSFDGDTKFLSGTIQDITESQKTKQSISRLSQVVAQNPYATIITDIEGSILYCNRQTTEMTGYTEDELLNKNMNIFKSELQSSKFYKNIWKTVKEDGNIWRGSLVNKMKNGELLDLKIVIFPVFDDNDKIVNFATIQENITKQKIQDKLFFMQTRHAQMGEMLSMIAHQWRQPLAIIAAKMNRQRINIALEQADFDDIDKTYGEIELQINHLSHTITDFRDFFKPDKKPVLTSSQTVINKSFALIEHAFKQHFIKLELDIIRNDEYLTFERELEQVVLNIFKNSQDALVDRKIKDPFVSVVCRSEEKWAIISIEDNAGGIDDKVIETLFLPYVSTKNQKHGTGLGLYMSKTIVEEHCGGSIHAENTKHGAKFIIKIPLKDTSEPE